MTSARRRVCVIALSLIGFGIATVLTLFQVGVLDSIWDPFFGDGSRKVLTSSVSQALPVPDASLGVIAYLLEAILESLGGTTRWRDHPWIIAAAGLVAVGLGLAALGLLAAQALLVGAFCTLCLGSAAISLTVAYLVIPKAIAAVHTLKAQRTTPNRPPPPGRHTQPRNPADPSQQ